MHVIRFALAIVVASQAGCATASQEHPGIGSAHFGDVTLSGDEIDARHVRNVWDLLRVSVPRYTFIEDYGGRAIGIHGHRGRSSIVLDSETPAVLIDGSRILYFDVLQAMPTDAVDRIEVLSALRGTSVEGTGASAGVIRIFTRSGDTK
jgi:outer membrane cobalamin receptor